MIKATTSAHLKSNLLSVRIFFNHLEVGSVCYFWFIVIHWVWLCDLVSSTLHFLVYLEIKSKIMFQFEGLWPIPTADKQKMRDNSLDDKRWTCKVEGAETVKPPLTHCTKKWKWNGGGRASAGVTCAPRRHVQQKATISRNASLNA